MLQKGQRRENWPIVLRVVLSRTKSPRSQRLNQLPTTENILSKDLVRDLFIKNA